MRLVRATLSAAGATVLALDPHKIEANMLPILYGNSTVNATAQVDGVISDLGANTPVSISRTTTTVTVTFPTTDPHRLGGTSDYITISGTGISGIDGTFAIATITSPTVLTYTSTVSATSTALGVAVPLRFAAVVIASAAVSATAPATVAVSATTLPLQFVPFSALILKCTIYTAGVIHLDVRQAGTI